MRVVSMHAYMCEINKSVRHPTYAHIFEQLTWMERWEPTCYMWLEFWILKVPCSSVVNCSITRLSVRCSMHRAEL